MALWSGDRILATGRCYIGIYSEFRDSSAVRATVENESPWEIYFSSEVDFHVLGEGLYIWTCHNQSDVKKADLKIKTDLFHAAGHMGFCLFRFAILFQATLSVQSVTLAY